METSSGHAAKEGILAMKRSYIWIISAVLIGAALLTMRYFEPNTHSQERNAKSKLVINEAARTLLYLPTYHAERMGYFDDENLDVDIVTGGSAATAVAAVISGDAQAAIADPMYAPISQANGSDVVVVGQIVGRVSLWALARPGTNIPFDREGLRHATIITHPKPMSSFTYTELLLQSFGISETDANIVEAKPGTEIATYKAEPRAQFIVAVEPVVSILSDEGAQIVYSWPERLGDRVFSGILVKRSTLNRNGPALEGLLRAYQRAMNDIAQLKPEVLDTAREYFPNLESDELESAIRRLTNDHVFPRSLLIGEQSWGSAVAARKAVGDLNGQASFAANVADDFTREALAVSRPAN